MGLRSISMERYAQLADGVVKVIIASATDPDGVNGEWIACGDAVSPGWMYDGAAFSPPAPSVVVDPCEWLIDLGPFYDRFGAAKMAVLTSADAGVKAIMADVAIRKWIDLQRTDVASSLAYIGSKVPSVDAALQTAILATPVSADENRALRKQYF